MKPQQIKSELTGDKYFFMNHPSGLKIFIYPKEDYRSSYAILGTNFGSVNNKFRIKGEKDITEVPDGIAHYLEHKLFEGEDGEDAFTKYAKTGASANAYTSFEKTAYLFSCAENFEDSLNILLDFVQSPYFTKENVQKEQGIIGQEIKMYQDNPEWKVLFNLLNGMYHNNPVKIDIAGSIESIAEITPEKLYKCYSAFYNLNNMTLCVAGDLDVDRTFTVIDQKIKFSKPVEVERIFSEEPRSVVKDRVEQRFPVSSPLFHLGFKEESLDKRVSTEDIACTDIILKAMSSKSSSMYARLLEEGLINTSSFSHEYFEGPGYASIIFSGESKDPEKTAQIIREEADRIRKNGIDLESFERARRAVYGETVAMLNSISSIANVLLEFSFSGKELFDYIEYISKVSLDRVNERLQKQLDSKYSCLSVIKPNE